MLNIGHRRGESWSLLHIDTVEEEIQHVVEVKASKRNHFWHLLMGIIVLSGCDSSMAPGGTESGFAQNGDVRLRWYLDLPSGAGPFPAVLYGAGSGNVAADHQSTIRFARDLNDLGFAVMRYDKRGTGDSDGVVPALSTGNSDTVIPLLAADMAAILSELRGLPDIDSAAIGLMGASQANWYMPVVAADFPALVQFMIVVTGGVLPVGMQNRYEELTRVDGLSPAEAEQRLGLLEDFTGPLGFQQGPLLQQLGIPMLYLRGSADTGSPRTANTAEMDRLAAAGVDLEYRVFPDGKHLLPDTDYLPEIEAWLRRKGLIAGT